LTFQDEKKKLSFFERGNLEQFVIPPSYFKKVTSPIDAEENTSEATTVSSQTNTETSVEEPFEQILPIPDKKEPEVSKHPERVIERPRILAERNAKRVSALSLRSIQKKKELKKEMVAKQPDDKILPVEDFSEAEMQTAWKDYTNKIEQEGKYNLLSHLTMGVPKLEGTLIHLVFPNNTIKVEVESAKRDLLSHLRSSLNNHNVDISIEVNEAEVKRYAYTTREKFDKLKEKNPLIENLRKEFDLDV
jgi:DNA polymerase-3 subunit gamma/tau